MTQQLSARNHPADGQNLFQEAFWKNKCLNIFLTVMWQLIRQVLHAALKTFTDLTLIFRQAEHI